MRSIKYQGIQSAAIRYFHRLEFETYVIFIDENYYLLEKLP